MHTVILGLGSNQGNRKQYVQEAVKLLRGSMHDITCSKVYESTPLLPAAAPSEWNVAFLNMVLCGLTELQPLALLDEIKTIEQKLGRIARGHWGPREIDIDILAFDEAVVSEPRLTIPHKELLLRDFALIPLAEVAPEWVHPVAKKSARSLAEKMPSHLNPTDIVIT